MVHNVNRGGVRRAIVTPADLEEERHRLRESKMLLLLMAEKAGLAVPPACCPHQGKIACLSCSSDWLVAPVRLASGSALCSRFFPVSALYPAFEPPRPRKRRQ